MNDVRPLFEGLVADPPPDPLDLDAVVARGTRRRRVRRTVAVGAGLAAALVVGSTVAVLAMPDDTRTAPPVTDPNQPEMVDDVVGAYTDLTCEPDRIELSPPTVAAQPFGVIIELTSTMPPGSYVSYTSDGASGSGSGDQLAAREGTWTLGVAPGEITLACEPQGDGERSETVLTVTDPRGYWRGDTVPGCEPGASPTWEEGLTGEGETAAEAVEATLDGFRAANEGVPAGEVAAYTATPTETGYPDGATQSWLVLKDDEPFATIAVVSHADLRYTAMPDLSCS